MPQAIVKRRTQLMFVRAYEYLFYKFYQWSIKVNGENNYPKYYATLMIGLALLINVASIPPVIEIFSGRNIINKFPEISKIYIVGVIGIYFLVHYIYFSYKNRYIKIFERYRKNENAISTKRGNIIVVIYVISSYVLLVALWFVGIYIREIRSGM